MRISRAQQSIRDARKTIVSNFFGASVFKDECPICTMNFEPGDKVEVLACHPSHMFHEACYKIFIETNEKNGARHFCPLCR